VIVPAEERDEYFPVYYVEPLKGNEWAVGLDLASDTRVTQGLEEARRSGESRAAASIPLGQETGEQRGVLIFLPVRNASANSGIERYALFRGFAVGVFRIGELFESAIEQIQGEIHGLVVEIEDITDLHLPQRLYHSKMGGDHLTSEQYKLRVVHSFPVLGRTWKLTSYATETFVRSRRNTLPVVVLVAGGILTLILTAYLREIARRERDVRQLVEQRTKELFASENKNRIIIEKAADAVITIDSKGIISLFNPTAEHIFGYKAKEVMGKNVKMLMPDPYHAEHDGYLARYHETGQPQIIGIGRETSGLRKDGTIFPLNLSVGEATIGEDSVYIGVLTDITAQKQTEQALIQAKESAEEANRQKSFFLNVMSHELRTPLTVILGYLPMLEKVDKMPEPAVVAQIARDMNLSGNYLLELITDLLDISKIEAGQMILAYESSNARALVHKALRKFGNQAETKGILLINETQDFAFMVDPKRFQQILINLVGNSLKFTKQGEIKVSAWKRKDVVGFKVSDTGIGIPTEELPYIFDTFRQVDKSSTREVGGTGLGLAITKRLVELHGGSIKAKSREGIGTSISFTIKLQQGS
jgi:PAS domain S-box-containing protein